MLNENVYQKSIVNKIFKSITNNYSSSQSQQTQSTQFLQNNEIKISINLPYVEGTSEIRRRILRSHEITFTFYTENTVRKLHFKPKDLE